MTNTSQVFSQNNLSAIEPDNSFEFQKDIENFMTQNNQDTSLQSADINDQINAVQTAPEKTTAKMVMIDQAQLQELLQAKRILDQKNAAEKAAAEAKINSVQSLNTQGFNSALFLTPPKTQINGFVSPSTEDSSQQNQQRSNEVKAFSAYSNQQSPMEYNSIFAAPLYSQNFVQQNSNYSQFHKQNDENKTNKQYSKLDSKFNKDFIEEESYVSTELSSRAQDRAIGADLMNIIDCDSSIESQPVAKPFLPHQNFNMGGDNYNSSPESYDNSGQSRSLNSSSGNESPAETYPSIFSQAPHLYQAQRYCNQTENIPSIKPEAINAPCFNPKSACFMPNAAPSSAVSTDASSNDNSKQNALLFDFPEGGWECSKCQNYNFKGRDVCYRCKKEKATEDCDGKPKHMSMAKLTKKQKKALKAEKEATAKQSEQSKLEFANKWASNPNYLNPQDKQAKIVSSASNRNGDWTCDRCQNHNFAFREACNICYMSQTQSNQITLSKQQQACIQQQQAMFNPQVQMIVQQQMNQLQAQMFYPQQQF